MNSLLKILRWLLPILLIPFSLVCLDVAFYTNAPFSGNHLLLREFLFGFWLFLRDHFPAISWDAGTWGPGLVAFLLVLLIAHRLLSRWATATNRYWTIGSSFCLVLVLPVLFVISFLVPGVLLQWELLRQTHWVEIS